MLICFPEIEVNTLFGVSRGARLPCGLARFLIRFLWFKMFPPFWRYTRTLLKRVRGFRFISYPRGVQANEVSPTN